MEKRLLLVFGLALLLLGLSIGQSHAITGTTTMTTSLGPGVKFTNFIAFSEIKTTETYGIEVTEELSRTFRFWIMNSTEYDAWQIIPSYNPACILNISTNFYLNNTFLFPANGDYVYGVVNEGGITIIVTIKTTRPSAIDGFTLFWVALGVLASAVIIYSYRQKSKRNLDAKFPHLIT
ncbi:MAG: hypothetical protein HWN65_17465 [Candidatus Helarchaeota archaeon]|nr:hypothetical protein [Candidatus Helarchaeota archaeon]